MNRNNTRRVAFNFAWLIVIACSVPALVGCPYPICRTSETGTGVRDFEDVCDGQPCDWEASVGMISSVPTYHSELLGMRIEEDAIAVTTRGARVPSFAETMTVRSLVSCEPGASLSLQAVVQPEAFDSTSPPPATRTPSVRLTPLGDMNTSSFQEVGGSLGEPGQILELRLEATGGACIIDDLEIFASIIVC